MRDLKNCITVLDVKDNPDGSATVNFEYGKEFAKLVRIYYGKKRATKKMVSTFVSKAISDTILLHSKKFLKKLEKEHGKRK